MVAECLSPLLLVAAVETMRRQLNTGPAPPPQQLRTPSPEQASPESQPQSLAHACVGGSSAGRQQQPPEPAAASMEGEMEVMPASSSTGSPSETSLSPGVGPEACGLSATDLVGEWRTQYGVYTVTDGGELGLLFEEPLTRLHGVLKPEGDWFVAEIFPRQDGEAPQPAYGNLRLRRDGEHMRSSFTHSLAMPWSSPGLCAQRLPYAATFAFKRDRDHRCKEADAEICCICLEEFEDGEIVSQLLCNHFFHRACVQHWLGMDGRCPLRCPTSNCN